jgi:hypothetical protein
LGGEDYSKYENLSEIHEITIVQTLEAIMVVE